MIISRTPFRVSLFGGGTDYPAWYKEHGGLALGATIDKYCYLTVRHLPPFFDHKFRVVWSKVETVNQIRDIQHPAVRAVMQELKVKQGLEIHHNADLPARSGLGSSSSFSVGLLNALRALEGSMSSPSFLANEAIRIEQQVIGENVGSQDQTWAAYGGTNLIRFNPDGRIDVEPLIMSPGRLEAFNDNLVLLFTGFTRFASEVAAKKIANISSRYSHLSAMKEMVLKAKDILQDDRHELREIGHMLHESWQLKKQLADSVSNPSLDEIYDEAIKAGALGGKLLGAGGGGFMLFYVEPDYREKVIQRLSKLIHVKFKLGAQGSKIVMYEPNGWHS